VGFGYPAVRSTKVQTIHCHAQEITNKNTNSQRPIKFLYANRPKEEANQKSFTKKVFMTCVRPTRDRKQKQTSSVHFPTYLRTSSWF
jgi:hypothetical protein